MLAGVVGAATLLLPSATLANVELEGSAVFTTFNDLCLARQAAEAPAVAAADHLGWMTLPDAMVPIPPSSEFSFTSKSVRLHSDSQKLQLLLVGRGSFRAKGRSVPADICVVGAKPDDQDTAAVIAQWAGVPSTLRDGISMYPFRDDEGRHMPAEMDDDLSPAKPGAGRFKIVGVKVDPATQLTMAVFIVLPATKGQ